MTFRDAMFDAETFRSLGYRAVDIATEHLANIGSGPVYQSVPNAIRSHLMDSPSIGNRVLPEHDS